MIKKFFYTIFYKSKRVGKGGRIFYMYKFRTLKENADRSTFAAHTDNYLNFGYFLRKTKLDELPAFLNVLKGDINIIGYRPEEERTISMLPEGIKRILLSTKPGLTDLASLYFFDEEKILQQSPDPFETYWKHIKPMKIMLQMFYINNKSFLLDVFILWTTFKKMFKALFLK